MCCADVQYADNDRGRVPYYVKDVLPAPETVRAEEALMFEEEEDDDVMEAKIAAAQAAKQASAIAAEAAETAAAAERDALSDLEDAAAAASGRGVARAADQEMRLHEFKAAVCRLAWLLCKGKTLADRLEVFVNMYVCR